MYLQFLGFFVFIFAVILTALIEKRLIPLLSRKAKQPIYEEGPAWHIKKQGTPTMGGLAFLIAISMASTIGAFFLSKAEGKYDLTLSICISVLYAMSNALIGIADDITKLRRRQNGGLTPTQKLVLQSLLTLLFLMARRYYFEDSTLLRFSFGSIDLGVLYYPFSFVVLLGIINCANLTDGIDGLAGGVGITIGAIVMLALSNICTDAGLIASALAGGCLGFLLFNVHPAKIFMGDTGSLFLGALVATIGFSLANPFAILLFGIVYVLEGLSVILQVIFFKLTKKRLFKMAPIHHHMEKCGLNENQICICGVALTLAFSLLALLMV